MLVCVYACARWCMHLFVRDGDAIGVCVYVYVLVHFCMCWCISVCVCSSMCATQIFKIEQRP